MVHLATDIVQILNVLQRSKAVIALLLTHTYQSHGGNQKQRSTWMNLFASAPNVW